MRLTLDEAVAFVLCIIEHRVMPTNIGQFALVHRQNTRVYIGFDAEKLSVDDAKSER